MIEVLLTVLIILVSGGFFYLYKKLEKPQEDREAQEKFQKMLFELESIQKNMQESRKETYENLDKNARSVQDRLDKTIGFLTKELRDVNTSVDKRLENNAKNLNERLDNASKVIAGVKVEMGKIQPHIHDLANIFKGPKSRGIIGEQILEEVLSQRLPADMWEKQYAFSSGDIVDVIIKTSSGIVPIDSKFPLDNYKKMVTSEHESEIAAFKKEFEKDVKKQIADIAKKYIRPEERTTPFAIMYLPSEDIYYEAVIRSEALAHYANEKNVTIVSPNVFYHFLGIVLLSLQSQKINEQAGEVLKMIKGVKTDSGKFADSLGVLSKHINNSYNTMGKVTDGFGKLANKIDQASDFGAQIPQGVTSDVKSIEDNNLFD